MTRLLYPATYVFLCLPYLFFMLGWLRAPYAAASVALLVYGTGAAIRSVRFFPDEDDQNIRSTSRAPLTILAPVFVVMALSGVGGWGYQDADWLRGNAVLLDLVEKPWPVIYQTDPDPLVLVYYFAFYLPAAWVGKIVGWQAANHALFVYGLAGLGLTGLWVTRVSGVRRWWTMLVFLGFSGMDIVGMVIRRAGEIATHSPVNQTWRSLEWWAGFGVVAFPSNMELLTLTAMQAIPAWLLTALVLSDARAGRLPGLALFYLGVSTLWAPYVSIGLLPLIGALTFGTWSSRRRLSELISGANALGLLLGLLSASFFAMRLWPHTLPMDVSQLYQEQLTLTLFRAGPQFLAIYPLFLALEFGILHALIYTYVKLREGPALLDTSLRRLLIVSTAGLAILPWINMSWNNDIVLRACIPMLFATVVAALRVLDDRSGSASPRVHMARLGVVLVLAVGGINAAWIFGKQLLETYRQGALVLVPDPPQIPSLFELQEQRYNAIGFNFVGQYMGSTLSPFATHILAEQEPAGP